MNWKTTKPKRSDIVIEHHDWLIVRDHWWGLDTESGGYRANGMVCGIVNKRIRLRPYHKHKIGSYDGMYDVSASNSTCYRCGATMPEFMQGFLNLADWSLEDENRL